MIIFLISLLLFSLNISCMVKTPAALETERIRLREFTLDDAEALVPILGDPEVMAPGTPLPLDEIKNFLKLRILPAYQQGTVSRYALIKKDTGALMGLGGFCVHGRLHIEDVPENYKPVALSIVLAKEYWRQKYATELMTLALIQASKNLQIPELIAVIDARNNASAHLAKNAGFRYWKKGKLGETPMDVYRLRFE